MWYRNRRWFTLYTCHMVNFIIGALVDVPFMCGKYQSADVDFICGNSQVTYPTLLLKLLTPSPYSMLGHGLMHWYDRIIFPISSHVFNEPQEWINSSATITGWFSVLRTQKRQPLHATDEYRIWSIYSTISCRKNPLLTELFNAIIR